MTYRNETFLALAMQQDSIVRFAAPRSILAAGAAYHFAAMEGDKQAREVLDTFGAALEAAGAGKGERSTKRKQAKQVGDKFGVRFAAELASEYASETDFVEACFAVAYAEGVKSVGKLIDFMVTGDALHTETEKARKEQDKAAEKQAQASDNLTAVTGADLPAPMLGVPVAPAPVAREETADPAPAASASLSEQVAALIAEFGAEAVAEEVTAQSAEALRNVA